MSEQEKGARLWLKPAYTDKHGHEHKAVWLIRDVGGYTKSTGCGAGDRAGAEKKLAEYIVAKHQPDRRGSRSPAQIMISDVISIYATDRGPSVARPDELAMRAEALLRWWGDKPLSEVNGANCRAYVAYRGVVPAARRELEDLRAAINSHRREGLCSEVVGVWLPKKSEARNRWLTRSEAARLLWTAWRAISKHRRRSGQEVVLRQVGKHLARFILVGLYTGTRSGAICGASVERVDGRGYVDLERGLFYRRAQGARETKKRQPPVRLPAHLLAHMRRWHRLGLCNNAVVEWNGKPVGSVRWSFASAVEKAGLEDVTPHTLRHTAATWLMQQGCDLWEAAGYLGMTVETLQTVYGHHHPDYQQGAVTAMEKGTRTASRR